MATVTSIDLRAIIATERTVWRHVLVQTDESLTGVGEYTGSLVERDLDRMAELAREMLAGEPVDGLDGPGVANRLGGSFEAWAVASAVDQALEDLRAQRAGAPLAINLRPGATIAPVALYANINRRTRDRSPGSFARSATEALNAGFNAIKIAPFDGLTPDLCGGREGAGLIEAGFDRIAAVGDVLAGGADLMVDCHWRFTVERTLSLLPRFASLGVRWLECPIPETTDAIPHLCTIRGRCAEAGIRLAGCETMTGMAAFEPFLSAGAYDVIMPDVKYAGGLRETLRIAEAAVEAGVACSLHNPSGPVAHEHSVHVAAATANTERLEYQFDESPLFFEITDPAPVIIGGEARLRDRAGLGIGLRDAAA